MKKRSNFMIMAKLVGLVKPLFLRMLLAITCGCLGFFCAAFITVLAGYGLIAIIENNQVILPTLITTIGVIAISRGILHYIEQYNNHFIAFKLLAIIRDKVFTALRSLAPAKLDGKDKGNLVSIITSDIELLEVFYAHTISPIFIALITSSVVVCFVGSFNLWLGLIALLAHLSVGLLVPIIISRESKSSGARHRQAIGELNSYFLDSLRGLKEILQFNVVKQRKDRLQVLSKNSEKANYLIRKYQGLTYSLTSLLILSFSFLMLFVSSYLYLNGEVDLSGVIIPTIMLFSSFGAVTSTANLGAGLTQTMASGNRVLDILEDKPVVTDIIDGVDVDFKGASLNGVSFAYQDLEVLKDFSLDIEKGKIVGISGKSGCGKSTTLKLLMRFYDPKDGEVKISDTNLKNINTKSLRNIESYLTQETHVFHDTIINNIRIANLNATKDEVIEACKKASVHEFIVALPDGYDTQVGELGDTISGGERQRIGIARAFLHQGDLILLDEPTSNLDSLNEGIILKSLKEIDKTIILVSHRLSTMKITDKVINMESTRKS